MVKARTVKVESRKAYRYLYAHKVGDFEDQVNDAIAEGYFPIGGVNINDRYLYSQAVVDREVLVALMADAVHQGTPPLIGGIVEA